MSQYVVDAYKGSCETDQEKDHRHPPTGANVPTNITESNFEKFPGDVPSPEPEIDKTPSTDTLKYKPVAKKVRPQETELPEEYRIKRRKHPNPFADMPPMPEHPPDFTPTGRLTKERYDEINWNPDEFLKTDEVKLLV